MKNKKQKDLQRSVRASAIISTVFAGIFILLLFALALILPSLVESLLNAPDLIGDRAPLTPLVHSLILVLAYVVLLVAFVAVVFLLLLLRCVWLGNVFSPLSVAFISVVSNCCFAEGLLFFLIGIWFQLSLLLFAAAFFIGLCLRIVGNVISEASRLKQENELTI